MLPPILLSDGIIYFVTLQGWWCELMVIYAGGHRHLGDSDRPTLVGQTSMRAAVRLTL